jgi:hypothetical protein
MKSTAPLIASVISRGYGSFAQAGQYSQIARISWWNQKPRSRIQEIIAHEL